MKNKILLAIADGVGDRPCEELYQLTPLEFAKKPHLNKIAAEGSCGIMDLYKAGVPVGTDLGHMLLFGYEFDDYPGRGPIEAAGEGLDMQAGDIALRANFATVDENMKVVDRRAGRIREGTSNLAQALNGIEIDGVKVLFKEATEHRAVMVLRGEGLSANITDTDPKKEGAEVKLCLSTDGSAEAEKTANIINKIIVEANKRLSAHPLNRERKAQNLLPANAILTRGAGLMPHLEKVTEKYGFRASCVAAETTVIGAAKLAGFNVITDPSFTGNIDTDIVKKAECAAAALDSNDLVVLHLKATDLMGHDNNPKGKVEAIEKYDAMLGKVLELVEEKNSRDINGEPYHLMIALAADHSTPCERKEHSGDPVPVVISAKNFRKDAVKSYDEISCAQGGLCRIKASEFISTLLDYLEVTKKQGN